MPLLPLDIPPGMYANGTDYQAAGRWRDGNLVRWQDKALRPIGGWEETIEFTGGGTHRRGAWVYTRNTGFKELRTGNAARYYGSNGAVFLDDMGGFQSQVGETFASTWAIDNVGQNSIAVQDTDGRIWLEDFGGTPRMNVIAEAPTGVGSLLVTQERFVMAFGDANNPSGVAWSDREDASTWTPAATNEAGSINLKTPGTLMQGVSVQGQVLILSDRDAHTGTYVGPPYVYGFEMVSATAGAISRKAAVAARNGAFWMGFNAFYYYSSGSVQVLDCPVLDRVFQSLNLGQRSKVWAFNNSEYSEVWWFYPVSNEIDHYVSYNHETGDWSFGQMERTTGVPRGVVDKPILIAPDGTMYNHETGLNYSGAVPYAETGPISLGTGDRLMSVTSMIPDEQTQGDVTATFKTRNYPNFAENSYGPYSLNSPTDVRFTGRQVRMRISGNNATDWRVGINRLDVKPRGKR